MEQALPEQRKFGTTIHRSLHQFEFLDLGLDGPIAVGERQSSNDSLLVLAQAVCKTTQFRNLTRLNSQEPGLIFLATTQTQHAHELLCQRIGLASRPAPLADQLSFSLFPSVQ